MGVANGGFRLELSTLVKNPGAGSLTRRESVPLRPTQRHRRGREVVNVPAVEGARFRSSQVAESCKLDLPLDGPGSEPRASGNASLNPEEMAK